MPSLHDAADLRPGKSPPALLGGQWALGLTLALIAALASINLFHWLRGDASSVLETVVQVPVPADNLPADNRSDVTAPDPGDNP